MANIPMLLAQHIDEVCGLHETGGVAQFFNEDGSLRPCTQGDNVFAFNIACNLLVYEPDEHDMYKDNVWNMIQGDIDGLNHVQRACDTFQMPECWLQVGKQVFWTDPDDGICSGEYTLTEIRGDVYVLDFNGSEVEAHVSELSEIPQDDNLES